MMRAEGKVFLVGGLHVQRSERSHEQVLAGCGLPSSIGLGMKPSKGAEASLMSFPGWPWASNLHPVGHRKPGYV
jgi:hypothetical protein